MFAGGCFAGDTLCYAPVLVPASAIEALSIQNAQFLEIFVTESVITDYDGNIPDYWTFETRLHARFKNDLYAGNVDFAESTVEAIKIKKRTSRDTQFQTIFERPILTNEDFAIEFLDYYEPVGDIEYAYVPVISGGEGDYIVNRVHSVFHSYFCVEKGISYPLKLDVSTSETFHYEAASVKPMGRKYPITIANGCTGYRSGSMECTFLPVCRNVGTATPYEYRSRIYEMLTNGKPKLLKGFNGELYMVNIEGNIEDSSRENVLTSSGLFTLVKSSFQWVECGDAYDAKELYYNGFTDVKAF